MQLILNDPLVEVSSLSPDMEQTSGLGQKLPDVPVGHTSGQVGTFVKVFKWRSGSMQQYPILAELEIAACLEIKYSIVSARLEIKYL